MIRMAPMVEHAVDRIALLLLLPVELDAIFILVVVLIRHFFAKDRVVGVVLIVVDLL